MKNLYLIGYSGHAFVVADSAISNGFKLVGYFESAKKELNPFQIDFLGKEIDFDFSKIKGNNIFVGIGENEVRRKISEKIENTELWCNVIDSTAIVASHCNLGLGIYIGKRAVVNPLSKIADGVIINTAAIVEHECTVGKFSHLAPMSVLCGNVTIGENTFIGANSVIRQGISIGSNVIVGAGSVITKNIPDNTMVYGNPASIKTPTKKN